MFYLIHLHYNIKSIFYPAPTHFCSNSIFQRTVPPNEVHQSVLQVINSIRVKCYRVSQFAADFFILLILIESKKIIQYGQTGRLQPNWTVTVPITSAELREVISKDKREPCP